MLCRLVNLLLNMQFSFINLFFLVYSCLFLCVTLFLFSVHFFLLFVCLFVLPYDEIKVYITLITVSRSHVVSSSTTMFTFKSGCLNLIFHCICLSLRFRL